MTLSVILYSKATRNIITNLWVNYTNFYENSSKYNRGVILFEQLFKKLVLNKNGNVSFIKVGISTLISLFFFFKASESLLPLANIINTAIESSTSGLILTREQAYILIFSPDPSNTFFEIVFGSYSRLFGILFNNFLAEYIFICGFIIQFKKHKIGTNRLRFTKSILFGLILAVVSMLLFTQLLVSLLSYIDSNYPPGFYFFHDFISYSSEGSVYIATHIFDLFFDGDIKKYRFLLIPSFIYFTLSALVSLYILFLVWFSILTTNNKNFYKFIAKICELLDSIKPKITFSVSFIIFGISTGLMQGFTFT